MMNNNNIKEDENNNDNNNLLLPSDENLFLSPTIHNKKVCLKTTPLLNSNTIYNIQDSYDEENRIYNLSMGASSSSNQNTIYANGENNDENAVRAAAQKAWHIARQSKVRDKISVYIYILFFGLILILILLIYKIFYIIITILIYR